LLNVNKFSPEIDKKRRDHPTSQGLTSKIQVARALSLPSLTDEEPMDHLATTREAKGRMVRPLYMICVRPLPGVNDPDKTLCACLKSMLR
jgi:hypothetical protein